ncbi:8-oxo-dGTP diphosphatase MutT [Granulosicoccus antarcticus]|uniref:8-oxo-dGTP diphosphatase n=1 Tax=Granulosicoccus antarcticus IMCC3135 TaxID=1192854 RepID=A0A2Z2NWN7_9GAMM|nr:8-oxo-dGTP diphosphatase MutT [Granulosicoccus antarcticus]ASJ75876.1 8-oxo-dGTP diphosphatase [Granulosicoccus antarcticus IMCC3135]
MKTIDVVAGVIFNGSGDKVLLALRKPEQHQGNRWEFPGGKLEAGEALQDGLVRELQEEIGIVVTQCQPRTIIEHSYPDKQVRLHFWDVTAFEGEPAGCEGQTLRWLALAELGALEFPEANQAIVNELLAAAIK